MTARLVDGSLRRFPALPRAATRLRASLPRVPAPLPAAMRLRATLLALAGALLLATFASAAAASADAAAKRLHASRFAVPDVITAGERTRVGFRLRGGSGRRAGVVLRVTPLGAKRAVLRKSLGRRRVGRNQRARWTVPPGRFADGEYRVSLHATDTRGRRLARSSRAPGKAVVQITNPAPPSGALFPVQGGYDLGGEQGRFGASRRSHVHQGHDVMCAVGTPIVTPVAGVVAKRAHQAGGGGHYLVIRGDDRAGYVFMHLHPGTLVPGAGARVAAGSPLGQCGQSGSASAPHLHFEYWPEGWTRGEPVDPLPLLAHWAQVAPGLARPN